MALSPAVLQAVQAQLGLTTPRAKPTVAVIYSADNPDDSLVLPFTPPFGSRDAAVKLTWSVAKAGGISRPHGRQERTYSLKMTLPSERDQNMPYVHDWRAPTEIVKQLQNWHAPITKEGTRLRFVVADRGVDATVYISQLGVDHEGVKEYTITLELTEWRVFTVRYDGEQISTATDAAAAQNPVQTDPPAAPDTPDQYAVQSGDTLWNIAQVNLGDGSRWQEIYELNTDTIGDDPDVLTPGQVLQLPTVTPGEADTNDPGQSVSN